VYTHFFSKSTCVLTGEFFQRKTDSYFFSKACWPFFFFWLFFFVFLLAISFNQFSLSKEKIKNNLQSGHGWYPKFTIYQNKACE